MISSSADRIGHITKFCSIVELLRELKNNLSMGKGKLIFMDFYT